VSANVTLVPHAPDPNGAATEADTNWVVVAGIGKSSGIAAVAAQVASDTTVWVEPSAKKIRMAANKPPEGEPALASFDAKTENTFFDASRNTEKF
jgi:hypothetical protein